MPSRASTLGVVEESPSPSATPKAKAAIARPQAIAIAARRRLLVR